MSKYLNAALLFCTGAAGIGFLFWNTVFAAESGISQPDVAVAAQAETTPGTGRQDSQPSSQPIPEGRKGGLGFEKDIAPIFTAKCVRCHGKDVQKSELNLSTPQGVLKGGASGEVIVAHKTDDSLLYDYIITDQMPPEDVKDPKLRLTQDEKKLIRDWIAAGAVFDSHAPSAGASSDAVTEDDVIPVMLLHCTACHGLRRQEAGLDLRSRQSMMLGGRSGPAIVPGNPNDSLLIQRIRDSQMPPPKKLNEVSVKPVEPQELERIERWIAQGALPSTGQEDIATTEPDPLVSDEDRNFWAFQPPKRVTPPGFAADVGRPDPDARIRNPIDAFVIEKLRAAGLSLAPEADLRTLVRRAHFDLTGLPPTAEELQAVLNDKDPGAYERLIDRLLESPHYGERWGRYWLDLAGYADSDGTTEQDLFRPFAYRYRDYVIRAFNSDKPYNRFLLEQLAGDELADYRDTTAITPEIYDNLVATGFLRMAPDGTHAPLTNLVHDRLGIIADELQILGSSVLGLTIQCARCHSHKFDPIPQRDYYRLAAVFKPAWDEHDWLRPNTRDSIDDRDACRYLPQVSPEEAAPIKAHNDPIKQEIAALQTERERAACQVRERLLQECLPKLPQSDRQTLSSALAKPAPERDQTQNIWIDALAKQLEFDEPKLRENGEYKKLAERIDKQIAELRGKLKATPLIQASWDRGHPSPTYILRRGEPTQPTRRVGPGAPSVLTNGRTPFEVIAPWPGAMTTGRRLAFAKWLTKPDHPLTARVMVNRIWLHHFGRGIVTTSDNFGKTGAAPSHPELLDWLALEFVQRGWSIKSMHRLVMNSATYRQSSNVTPEQMQRDPGNLLVSRMPLRRLDAESLRDSLLIVSGRLDERPFGPADEVDARPDGLITVRGTERGWRRSIYTQQRRTQIPTLLESFDLPQMSPNCVARANSTVAPQALQLLNDGQIYELAQSLASRILNAAGSDLRMQIDRLYTIALNRSPTSEETRLALSSLESLTDDWLMHRRGVVESSAETWIRESAPDAQYNQDLIYVHSRKGSDGARRVSLVEFDLTGLRDLKIMSARLELSPVQAALKVRQKAALVPPGIEEATWKKYQDSKVSAEQLLDSLGSFDLTTKASDVGKYCVSEPASEDDLKKLRARIEHDGRVTLALQALEGSDDCRAEWDDGEGPRTNGKKPRLVMSCEGVGDPSAQSPPAAVEQAQLSALVDLCHAIFNSPEFIYVD